MVRALGSGFPACAVVRCAVCFGHASLVWPRRSATCQLTDATACTTLAWRRCATRCTRSWWSRSASCTTPCATCSPPRRPATRRRRTPLPAPLTTPCATGRPPWAPAKVSQPHAWRAQETRRGLFFTPPPSLLSLSLAVQITPSFAGSQAEGARGSAEHGAAAPPAAGTPPPGTPMPGAAPAAATPQPGQAPHATPAAPHHGPASGVPPVPETPGHRQAVAALHSPATRKVRKP